MSLLPKLGALLRRCQAAQSRCEAELAQLARQDGALAAEQEALASQGQGLRQLLLAQRPAGAMSRGQLFALQRKQAVLRRQLQNLDLQSGQLEEQRQGLAGRREEQQVLRRQWLRKEDKYQRWAKLQRRQERMRRLRLDEAEQEERTIWTR
ncbi:hypothetical protein JD974_14490 [Chromobacterium haemolyticum]|uniref:Type III secretion system protein SpaM n=1 Tax=Chromobacterium haemolyticum TaxID=394935 RepID=A0ABS3GK51_9NEIS|nr:hypothetical protein [Chromobacterium haemolyticum]MBK0415613.1 hypothetical protein [Chromobacterium haemolyticum]MBO0414967.1 hypothetical protein [Chromobacterium haemolyticum]MBO0498228.1 hypothetical protein [Chromobacterium haemolyticum]OQS35717.1 hypothetical protein B0T39_17560 [Chromobacterium haemolyticum]OQS35770.1 hypothetical protein B0T40_11995 [Chromobacterium haemolyticum]